MGARGSAGDVISVFSGYHAFTKRYGSLFLYGRNEPNRESGCKAESQREDRARLSLLVRAQPLSTNLQTRTTLDTRAETEYKRLTTGFLGAIR
jgi:hypothetical protein